MPEEFGPQLLNLVNVLCESIAHFERLAPFTEIKDYDIRMLLAQMERVIVEQKPQLKKEQGWLSGKLTVAVVDNASDDISDAVTEFVLKTFAVYRKLGGDAGRFAARFGKIQADMPA
jgi:hypothetical protein